MALMEMEQVKDAALKYDKPTLARLAQSGQLSPTTAIMAGMMRDRIVQSEMKPPAPPTVAEEVMQPMGQRMGLGAIAPGGQPQAPQQMPPQMPQGQGLDQVPIPPQMFDEQRMAGGGIVAFQAGGQPPSFAGSLEKTFGESQRPMPYTAPRPELTAEELKEYERLKNLGLLDSAKETATKLGMGLQDFIKNVVSTQKKAVGSVVDPIMDYFSKSKPLRETLSPKPPMPEEPGFVPSAIDASASMIDPFSATETFGGDPALAASGAKPSVAGPVTTTSPDMLKQAAKEGAQEAQERKAIIPPPEAKKETPPTERSFSDILSEVKGRMPEGEAYGTLEREVLKDRESRAQEKKDAGWLRLAEAGLGIMGGESPYAMVNIGKGAAVALKGYAEDLKDQKKLNRDDRKILADIEQARRAEKAGNIKLASEIYEKALDRTNQADQNRLRVEAQLQAAMMSASRPADQVQMIREMMKDPKFKEAALSFAAAQAAAKDPLTAAIAERIKAAAGGGGSNVGAQLGELMKKYPEAFKP